MTTLDSRDFPSLYFPFEAVACPSAETLWISRDYDARNAEERMSVLASQKFRDRFSYLIPGGITFDGIQLDTKTSKVLMAERYGGEGISDNGGGARCGNIDGFQVKGIGKNPLAGSRAGVHHSYGGFKAVYAVHETIYTHVLNRILPLGAARIFGVILTGPRSAYVSGLERGWGAQLVREQVIRPASFLRAPTFLPQDAAMISDIGRVRGAHVALLKTCGSRDAAMHLLGRFIERTARQMAFARLARIMHGAITPSNLCFDGRWIDLTNTSFLCSTKNYAGGNRVTASFYEEQSAVQNTLTALSQAFEKFHGKGLPIGELIERYQKISRFELAQQLWYVFGLRQAIEIRPIQAAVNAMLGSVMRVLSSGAVVYDAWPDEFPADDPILSLIEKLFAAASHEHLEEMALSHLSHEEDSKNSRLASSITRYMQHAHATGAFAGFDYRRFLVASCITAVKRCMLAGYYYKRRLEKACHAILSEEDTSKMQLFIEESIEISGWALEAPGKREAIILRCPELEVSYSLASGKFLLKESSRGEDEFSTLQDISNQLESRNLIQHEYDFRTFLQRLTKTVDGMLN